MDFIGTGQRLAFSDIGQAAAGIGVKTAALLSILEIEAGSRGFDAQNRLTVLPEPHRFYAELGNTDKRREAIAEGLAYKTWGEKPYPKSNDARYHQIERMIAIDQEAGLRACSWALPQILGSNCLPTGYDLASGMVGDFLEGEAQQVNGLCRLLGTWNLVPGLRTHDLTTADGWIFFATRYNGTGFRKNDYHNKLARAYRKHISDEEPMELADKASATLQVNMKGELVRNLQADLVALGFKPGPVDGRFGDKTDKAVRAFQRKEGLVDDGKVGAKTRKALAEAIEERKSDVNVAGPDDWDRD